MYLNVCFVPLSKHIAYQKYQPINAICREIISIYSDEPSKKQVDCEKNSGVEFYACVQKLPLYLKFLNKILTCNTCF